MRPSLAALPALLAACLSAPPGSVRDGDGGSAADAAGGPDAAPEPCPSSLDLPLTSEADLDGWTRQDGDSCAMSTTGVGLEFTNQGSPSTCRVYIERAVDLTDKRIRVRLNDAAPDLSMAFSVVIGSSAAPFSQRRWLYFDRDQGELMFGECNQEIDGCIDTFWGSIEFQPGPLWLRFWHDPIAGALLVETSSDGTTFNLRAAPNGVSPADLTCIGIDLGSYEEDTSGTPTASSFSDLSVE